eukprot:jgi/Botrbrau1/11920/Bobra.0259s0009.1
MSHSFEVTCRWPSMVHGLGGSLGGATHGHLHQDSTVNRDLEEALGRLHFFFLMKAMWGPDEGHGRCRPRSMLIISCLILSPRHVGKVVRSLGVEGSGPLKGDSRQPVFVCACV